ncbi:MAG TPA: hypothetical protein VGU69_12990 [Rhizomicrobium sp.]|nr:hypothetical protein [Rhizomicrobium sp.]
MFNFTNKPKRSILGRRSRAAALAVTLLAGTSYTAFAADPPSGLMAMIGPMLNPILAGPSNQVWPQLSGLLKMFKPDMYDALNGPLTQLNTIQPDLIPKLIKSAMPLLAGADSVTADALNDLLSAIIPQAAPGAPLNPLIQPGGFLDNQLKTTLAPFLAPGGVADQLLGKGKPLADLLKPGGLLAGLAAPGGPFEAFANEPDPAAPPPVEAPPPATTTSPEPTAPVVAPPPVVGPPVEAQPVVAPVTPTSTAPVAPVVIAPANTPMASTYGLGTTVDAADIKTGPVVMDGATVVFNKPSTVGNAITSAAGGLTVDTEANGELAGVISGPGGLTKAGDATLKLSAINTYTGDTDLKSGLLNVAGSLVNSTVVVENGATLGGTGTVYQIHTKAGAAVSPGNSIGTLKVGSGGVQMDPGSIYHVEIDKDGRSDRIATQGAASIGGAKLVVTREFSNAALTMADLAGINQTYDILDAAGGISGKFDTASLPHYAFFDIAVDYSNVTSVMLTVGRNGLTFAAVGNTPNQRAIGAGVEGLGNGNPLYGVMLSSASTDDARTMEQQLSGEIHGDVLGEVLDDSAMIRNAVIDRLNNRDPEGSASGSRRSTASDRPVLTATPQR